MEHTHLVKGLDFALLQKVRAEIETLEEAEVDEEEEVTIKEVSKKSEEKTEKNATDEKDKPDEEKTQTDCRTVMGRNIMRNMFSNDGPRTNELFMAGRMAYVMDLEEDGESDIPTTSIRSKKDVINSEQKATLNTNDIVINKLTQILSYLRAGNRTKRKKKDKMEDILPVTQEETAVKNLPKTKEAEIPIYDDVGDYRPNKKDERKEDRKKDKYRDEYRERDRDRERERDRRDRDRDRDERRHDRYRDDRDRDRERGRDTRGRFERDNDRDDRRGEKKTSYFDRPSEDDDKQQQHKGFSNEDKVCIQSLNFFMINFFLYRQ